MYESLTKYLLEFPGDEKGMWIIDKKDDVYSFAEAHEEMGLNHYNALYDAADELEIMRLLGKTLEEYIVAEI